MNCFDARSVIVFAILSEMRLTACVLVAGWFSRPLSLPGLLQLHPHQRHVEAKVAPSAAKTTSTYLVPRTAYVDACPPERSAKQIFLVNPQLRVARVAGEATAEGYEETQAGYLQEPSVAALKARFYGAAAAIQSMRYVDHTLHSWRQRLAERKVPLLSRPVLAKEPAEALL